LKLSPEEAKIINNYSMFAGYIYTWLGKRFLNCDKDVLALFFGNQAGKGALVVINYILRIMGYHPVARKNVLYYECETAIKYEEAVLQRKDVTAMDKGHYFSPANIINLRFGVDPFTHLYSDKYICPHCHTKITPHIREGAHRIFRFAGQSMPGSETTAANKGKKRDETVMSETRNPQFVELMKWMPPHLLKDKKISVRDANLYVNDIYGVGDIIIEFVSFNQVVQTGAGVQRLSTWLDELAAKQFFDEQIPRLLAVRGADVILSYTVTKEVGYLFDLIWNRAKWIYRSESIVDFFKKERHEILPRIEETDSEFKNIAVFHGSTFDNPTLPPDRIIEMMKLLHDDCTDDENVMNMRLYCLFSEVSSVIFPSFNMRTHVIDPARYFTDTGEVILN
jgi:hypothetical protein